MRRNDIFKRIWLVGFARVRHAAEASSTPDLPPRGARRQPRAGFPQKRPRVARSQADHEPEKVTPVEPGGSVEALELARWQFGVTTVYHFLFVPVTIGLALPVAMMQTAWHRTKNPVYLRMTRFWGKLMLISFAVGVVTGIVQEFQFGMNWSGYSRFVGDVFGAPSTLIACDSELDTARPRATRPS